MHAEKDKTNFCQGSDLQISTGIIENAIILEQLKITIDETKFLSETGSRLISQRDGSWLPVECKGHHNFCYTQFGTYVWNSKTQMEEDCNFEHYRLGPSGTAYIFGFTQ